MGGPVKRPDPVRQAQLLAELRREQQARSEGYRAKALTIFPHVCGRCGREFSGKRLRELTVHHKDHNWKNNPPDGSNWELLCIYCHDHEHEKYKIADYYTGSFAEETKVSTFQPFAGLDALVKPAPAGDAPKPTDPDNPPDCGPTSPDGNGG